MTETSKAPHPPSADADIPHTVIASAVLMAAVVAYGLHAIFISGPMMREDAAANLARVIAEEDRDVCGQFGLRPDTSSFEACSRELATVRQKQSDRDKAAAAGIL
jgi:hypothetical protein